MDVCVPSGKLTDAQRSAVELALGAQLVQMLGEGGESNDMLVEYIMVMIVNGKNAGNIAKELVELIGEDKAKVLATWISDCLSTTVLAPPMEAPRAAVEDVVTTSSPRERGTGRRGGGQLLAAALQSATRESPPRDGVGPRGFRAGNRRGRDVPAAQKARMLSIHERLGAPVAPAEGEGDEGEGDEDWEHEGVGGPSANISFTAKQPTANGAHELQR